MINDREVKHVVEYSKLFVVLFGIGVVFFGLVCIIVLTVIMGKIMTCSQKSCSASAPTAPLAPSVQPAPPPTGIAPEVIAAITAALSEEPGISSHGVNITSIKKL